MYGRRPAYLLCFVIYFGANLGLALQNSYAALLVLRCVQSSGSSGTATLAQAVTADVTTRAERGKYLAYVVVGITMGPALGPVGFQFDLCFFGVQHAYFTMSLARSSAAFSPNS